MTAQGRTMTAQLKIKVQIYCGDEIAMGPGKADLLEAIQREGSISAAGRALGMSYRRTWLLVDVMNRCWDSPLVEAVTGGSHGGGARITELGLSILHHFRALQDQLTAGAANQDWASLQAVLRSQPKSAQRDA